MIMRTFAREPALPDHTISAMSTVARRAHPWHGNEMNSNLHLRRVIGNPAMPCRLEADIGDVRGGATTPELLGFDRNFSRTPLHGATPRPARSRDAAAPPRGAGEQATEHEVNHVGHTAHGSTPTVHDFGALRILPIRPREA